MMVKLLQLFFLLSFGLAKPPLELEKLNSMLFLNNHYVKGDKFDFGTFKNENEESKEWSKEIKATCIAVNLETLDAIELSSLKVNEPFKVKIMNDDYLYFNFCKDIEKKCNSQSVSTYIEFKDGKCKALDSGVSQPNQWIIGPNTLNINLNSTSSKGEYTASFNMVCNSDLKVGVINVLNSSKIDGTSKNIIITAESNAGKLLINII